MDVYSSVSSITDSGVPAYLKSLAKGADAEEAYAGFLSSRLWWSACGQRHRQEERA